MKRKFLPTLKTFAEVTLGLLIAAALLGPGAQSVADFNTPQNRCADRCA